MNVRAIPVYLAVLMLPQMANAQGAEDPLDEDAAPSEEAAEDTVISESDVDSRLEEVDDDTAAVDVENSIDAMDASRIIKEWFLRADVRGGFFYSETDQRDGSSESTDEIKLRARIEAEIAPRENLRFKTRLAGACSTDDCSPEFSFQSTTSTQNSIVNGEITFDEAFLHYFIPKGNIAVGRLQTKFVARGGVFAKSMDRNDSNNININWTDGLHASLKSRFDWAPHLILQRNNSKGSSSIRRGPLDFEDDGSRLTYFAAFENVKPWGPIVQRGLDISYLPDSLLKDGTRDGRIEDYWGVVGRVAARWTVNEERNMRLRISGEIGYAPETPTREASGIGTSGSSDGLGWALTTALMDFYPRHSIGLNYGQMGAGWLLSPQYRENEELLELRYVWRYRDDRTFEFRIRSRKELDPLVTSVGKRDAGDVFLRLTSKFNLLER